MNNTEEVWIDEKQILSDSKKAYLLSTDWYYVRKLERNINIPNEVVVKRAEAIKFIQDNEEVANV